MRDRPNLEFGLSGTILLASSSPAGRRRASNYLEIARTCLRQVGKYCRPAISSRAGRRPASDLLASWIVRDRPNSITLSSVLAYSSLADHRPARDPARELVRYNGRPMQRYFVKSSIVDNFCKNPTVRIICSALADSVCHRR